MTAKKQAIETIENMPDSATLEDIMAQLYFCHKVDRGLKDLQEGRVVTHEQARERLTKWLQR